MASSIPEEQRRLVCATVLYWRPRELPLLEQCVTSLLVQECAPPFELRVTLIDNGCGIVPELPADPRLHVVQLSANRGFAGGHNVGLRKAMALGAEYVFLFNSDAVAEPGCLAELLAVADGHASAALIGPLILRATADDCVESAGQSFNPTTGRHTELSRGSSAARVGTRPRSVDAASGCALLARVSALAAIGLLDEGLFAYFEDMHWCLRARQAGYSVQVAPGARVRHLGGGSTGPASPLTTYYSVRNHMIVAGRYGGRLPSGLALAYHLAYVLRSPQRRTRCHLVALIGAAWDACTGRLGPRHCGADRH